MKTKFLALCAVAAAFAAAHRSDVAASPAPVELIGVGTLPASTSDGLSLSPATLEDGTPHDRAGGFGSAIAYTGVGALYVATPDRGPADGTTSYIDRRYVLDIHVTPGAAVPVTLGIADARTLHDGAANFTGNAAQFDATNSPASLRLDPEGVRVGPNGTMFVSDEYGPFLYEFDADGNRLRSLDVPSKFLIDHPAAVGADELPPGNTKGRQSNRGMEGLAISPDGTKLFGIMQNALIQDGALNASNSRRGVNNRILEIDVATGATREFVYQVTDRSYGVNEIVAVDDHQFLVLERDGNGGAAAAFKKIFLVDVAGATDVSSTPNLPQTGLPVGVTPAAKSATALLDLLDPAFGLAGANFPEKIEGLSFGPRLADGRLCLLVTNDNDFLPTQAHRVYAFAIDPTLLPGWEPQTMTPAVDVRPGDSGDAVNFRSNGALPIAVLSGGLFDASYVDPASVTFAGAHVRLLGNGRPQASLEDVNGDGRPDLVVHVSIHDMDVSPSATSAMLAGLTTTGTPIKGVGTFHVVPH